jgi:hypothetical protein
MRVARKALLITASGVGKRKFGVLLERIAKQPHNRPHI